VFLINDKINRINQIIKKKGITSKYQSINSKDQGQNYLIFMRYHVVPQDGMIIEHVMC
jgi:hypothetical protein